MTLSIALAPLLSLLLLAALYVVFSAMRATRIAALRTEHDQFTQRVLVEDATLQASLIGDLMEGKPLAETLDGFQRRRAALLPAARLDDPAAWDAEELERQARQQLAEGVSAVNRRLGTGAALSAVCIMAACALVTAVLYGFQPAVGAPIQPPAWPVPAYDPTTLPGADQLNLPPANPPPSLPDPPAPPATVPAPAPPAPPLPPPCRDRCDEVV